MRTLSRSGVTLLELLLVITLLTLLGVMVTAVVVGASRVAARATAQLVLERTVQVAATFLRYELRDGEWGNVAVAADAVTMRRAVGEGSACATDSLSVWLRRSDWQGDRAPEAGRDRLLLLSRLDEPWREAGLTDITLGSCPDGAAAWRLAMTPRVDSVRVVRVIEPVLLRRYRAGANDWLGLAPGDGSSPVQPFAGPLTPGAARFLRVGDSLRVELVTTAGNRAFTIPLAATP